MSRLLSLLVAAPALLVAPAPAAHAVEHDSRGAAAEPVVTIHGRGFGHGRGMSQYGALGRANDGDDYRTILGFYYPETGWGTASGRVRALISADTTRSVVVLDRDGLTVRALASGGRWEPRVAATRWRIAPTADGGSVVSYLADGWHEWRSFPGEAQFSAGGAPLTLVTPAGEVAYRGALRSAVPSGDYASGPLDRDTVNVLSLDNYLKGVVPQEVPAQWPGQAVRAQSVAARTYAAFERADAPAGRHFDVWDTTRSQVYGGLEAEEPESNVAVADTGGEILTFGGEPAFTQFSASNGGWSVQGQVHGVDVPYLPAQADLEDGYDPSDGYPDGWKVTLAGSDVTRHWPGMGTLESLTVTERDGNGQWGGRVRSIRVTGSAFSRTVSGETFRSYLGLRSTLFEPTVG